MIGCPQCGTQNSEKAVRCTSCGVNLQTALDTSADAGHEPAPLPSSQRGGCARILVPSYETRRSKVVDLVIGFVAWVLVNGGIWIQQARASDYDSELVLLNLLVLPANVIVLVLVLAIRRWMALGILTALAVNLAVSLILGLASYGACGVPFFVDSVTGGVFR